MSWGANGLPEQLLKIIVQEIQASCLTDYGKALYSGYLGLENQLGESLVKRERIPAIAVAVIDESRRKQTEQQFHLTRITVQYPDEFPQTRQILVKSIAPRQPLTGLQIKLLLQELQFGNGEQAKFCMRQLKSVRSIDKLYSVAIEESEEFPLARQVLLEANYKSKNIVRQILFYALTEQWAKLDALKPNPLILRMVFNEATPALRDKIINHNRQVGQAHLVRQALAEAVFDKPGFAPQEHLVTELLKQEKWTELWQLAQNSPPYQSATILHKLVKAGWQPADITERKIFKRLIRLAYPCRTAPMLGRLTQLVKKYRCSPNTKNAGLYRSEKFTPDAKYLIIAHPQQIEFYNLATQQLEFTVAGTSAPEIYIPWQELKFSQDGRFLFYQSLTDSTVETARYYLNVLDIQERRVVACLEDFEAAYKDFILPVIPLSPTKLLIYARRRGGSHNYWIYDLSTQTISRKLVGPPGQGLRNLALSPNGLLLAGRDSFEALWVWSVPDKELVASLPDSPANSLHSLEFSPDSTTLAYATPTEIYLLDIASGDIRELELSRYYRPTTLRFSPDGQVLAVGYYEANVVVLWHVREARPLQTLKWLDDMAIDLVFSPDGSRLLSLSRRLQVHLWQSPLLKICQRPLAKNSLLDLEWLQKHKQDTALRQGAERAWLKFCQALLLCETTLSLNWRHDVLLETELVPTAHDIEVAE